MSKLESLRCRFRAWPSVPTRSAWQWRTITRCVCSRSRLGTASHAWTARSSVSCWRCCPPRCPAWRCWRTAGSCAGRTGVRWRYMTSRAPRPPPWSATPLASPASLSATAAARPWWAPTTACRGSGAFRPCSSTTPWTTGSDYRGTWLHHMTVYLHCLNFQAVQFIHFHTRHSFDTHWTLLHTGHKL